MKLLIITIILAVTLPIVGFAGSYSQDNVDDFKLIHYEYQPRNFQ